MALSIDLGPVLPISLRNPRTGALVGTVTKATSTSVAWRHNAIDTAVVTLAANDKMAPLLADTNGVNLAVIEYGGQRFTGFAVSVQGSGTPSYDLTGGLTGTTNGTVTVTLASDWSLIAAPVAYPVPLSSVSDQTSAIQDTRSGPLEQVIKGVVIENSRRLRLPIMAMSNRAEGPIVGPLSARMTPMLDVLRPLLAGQNWQVTTRTWFPGDPQPYTSAGLSTPTVVMDVVPTRSPAGFAYSAANGTLLNWSYTVASPGWDTSVMGGNGQDAQKTFASVLDRDRRAIGGVWRASEDFADARDIQGNDSMVTLIQRGVEHNVEGSPKSGVSVTVRDGAPWKFGTGASSYLVGDACSIDIYGTRFADRVTSVTVTESSKGVTVTPQIGDSNSQGSIDPALLRTIQRLQSSLSRKDAA